MSEKHTDFSGLSADEVKERIQAGKVNASSTVKTKSIKSIFRDNILTVFNGINILLFITLLLVGSYKNLLFIGVVLMNTVIGIVQEIRSKRSVDKLTILTQSKLSVRRGGETVQLSKDELVEDDIIMLSRGDQIPADCVLISGSCSMNESLLTGEADLIEKREGDELLSGSFIAAGGCVCRVMHVGADSYAARINNEAKYIKQNDSQMLKSFKFIINLCTVAIFPIGILMYVITRLLKEESVKAAAEATVGALVGMIPGGMILLTSTVLAVSVIRLARKKVLVNEMYCIETLARVDVLCLDKTGTLTAEKMTVSDVIPFDTDIVRIKHMLASIAAASEDINATMQAIADFSKGAEKDECMSFVPFSSETKWSGGSFENGKSYIIGAAEFVFSNKERYQNVYDAIAEIKDTVRILALGESDMAVESGVLPGDIRPIALVLIKDVLRDHVQDTVNYFKEQGVTLKVISGDGVKTVQNIARDCGIDGADNAVDMSTVTSDEELKRVAEECNIFGRVTPAQKKKLILAMKENGHKVAMTGDGVNDVLALKEADCSVAMAAGSEAARNVSQLVLVNNDFASMPGVVAEGRRTINNIERSSSLYLVKTIYSIVLSVFFLFSALTYPFVPIQLTLIGALTVGFPSFVLALQPNKNIVRGNFTLNILSRALPAAICVILNIIVATSISGLIGISQTEVSTIAVYMTTLIGMMLIVRLSVPFNALRAAMLAISSAGLLIAFFFFGKFFNLTTLGTSGIILLCAAGTVTVILFNLLYDIADKLIEGHKQAHHKHNKASGS